MTVDPVTLEVFRNGITTVSEEMNSTLIRSSYSPNIKERKDCSCAVFDADGELLAQAENIPVHLGAMPFSVAAALDAFPASSLEPGDGIVVNDPFHGGAHLPDVTLVSPVFVDGSVIAFVANRAHHADIGGTQASSIATDATTIYQEGLRIPPVQLSEGGDPNEDLLSVLLANVRTPTERRGDLRAQGAANDAGRRRFTDLVAEHGATTVTAAAEELKAYAERRMEAALEALPDGTYSFQDVIEDDGRGTTDLPVAVTVRIDGASVTVDFTGSAPQTTGPLNAVFAVTASATYYALRAVTDPEIPPNAGCYRPIDIVAPEGTIVNAEVPAAVVGGNLEVSQRVTDVVLGALADCVPERVPAAGQGTMNNVTFGGTDPETGAQYAFYETQGGGFGAHPTGDGLDGVHVHMSNTMNTPAEVLQTAYPLAVKRYELRPDSGGAGEYRGGLGLRRDIEVRGHQPTCSLLAERHRKRPYGLAGGAPGAPGRHFLIRDGETVELPAKTAMELEAGDIVSIQTPGGGGYGEPTARDTAAVRADVAAGKVSKAAAEQYYDVSVPDSE